MKIKHLILSVVVLITAGLLMFSSSDLQKERNYRPIVKADGYQNGIKGAGHVHHVYASKDRSHGSGQRLHQTAVLRRPPDVDCHHPFIGQVLPDFLKEFLAICRKPTHNKMPKIRKTLPHMHAA